MGIMHVFIENKVIDKATVKTFVVSDFHSGEGMNDFWLKMNLIEMINYEANRSDFKTIECLNFENCSFSEFPSYLGAYFQHVKYLHAVNCGIRTVSYNAIAPFENLEGIFLDGNDITDFPYQQLLFNSKIRVCSFGSKTNAPEEAKIFLQKNCGKQTVFESFLNGSIETLQCGDVRTKPNSVSNGITAKVLDEVREELKKTATESLEQREHEQENEVRLKVLPTFYDAAYALNGLKDFAIIVDKTTFKVHRVVLASHSKLMLKMLEKHPEALSLTLHDVGVSAVQTCIDFMYKGYLPDYRSVTKEEFLQLMVVSETLGIDGMYDFVENLMKLSINPKIVVEVLKRSTSQKLKFTAFEYVKQLLSKQDLHISVMNNPQLVEQMLNYREKIAELERERLEAELRILDMSRTLDSMMETNSGENLPGYFQQQPAKSSKSASVNPASLNKTPEPVDEKRQDQQELAGRSLDRSNESFDECSDTISELSDCSIEVFTVPLKH